MDMYENQELQDLAREQIPIHRLKAEATALQQSDSPLPCEEDALAEVLVQWFKKEYFKWADPIKCPKCSGKTQVSGMVPPAPYERGGGAGRVELHVCTSENGPCDGSFRFPRYNDPKYLMKTRLGRCGEWANLYTLFLRAVGLRARYGQLSPSPQTYTQSPRLPSYLNNLHLMTLSSYSSVERRRSRVELGTIYFSQLSLNEKPTHTISPLLTPHTQPSSISPRPPADGSTPTRAKQPATNRSCTTGAGARR
ncbi:Peptide-N(4)-(N-acetyl-beta- glucosaminyl)asparagine amidase [Ceratobasidium sp. 428]|nr:Peptide-N(4)-(N-acetyl-beta- glucosaminyl)asparagine amidase [Ceratobasidium sp. 428]